VAELAAQLRVDSIRSSTRTGSGYTTSSMSAADLLAVLPTRHLRFDWDAGVVSEDELMTTYRRFGRRLQGHPTPVLPWVDVATSINPVNGASLAAAAAATSGRIVVAEDHRSQGGLGSAVAETLLANRAASLSLARLAVRDMPGSGSSEERLAWAGIDADHIPDAARRLLDRATVAAA
jgi:Transketolase, C-terminal domain